MDWINDRWVRGILVHINRRPPALEKNQRSQIVVPPPVHSLSQDLCIFYSTKLPSTRPSPVGHPFHRYFSTTPKSTTLTDRWRNNDGTDAQQEMVGSRVLSSELAGIVEIEQDKAEMVTKVEVK